MSFRLLLLILLAVAPFSGARLHAAPAAERVFDVTGIVRGRLDDGRLVIEHDEIPGFMAAMTMAFNVADPKEAAALRNEDRVRFRFRVSPGSSVAEGFVVTGRAPPPAPAPTAARGSRLRPGDAVPDFALVDENGQPLTAARFRDRLTVVTFIFTRCPVPEFCPALALRFGEIQKALRTDLESALAARVRLLSVTLDPEFDRPEILKVYGESIGADPAVWNFATGDQAVIDGLSRAFAVFAERNGATLDHSLCTALIGPEGRVVELWRGSAWKAAEVLAALRTAGR